ncbi:MAG: N-methyl-L-tryptophan oxidase [Bryobacterales bacterium]|nr:N-methyl-L-tryptophan oxidase [Bryobacterales bacterium]
MYDAIVVGLGGMGSATLYHLARSGHRVLGLEQFEIGHAMGSSHGSTRIIRLAYSEGPEYVPLLQAAYRNWRELECASELDEPLLHVTGGLDIGPAGSWIVEGSKQSCLEHGLDFEELDAGEVNRRFGGYRLPDSMVAIYQPDGGYVLSEAAIHAHIEGAIGAGASVRSGLEVIGWERHRSGLRVETSEAAFEAKRLVVTAGPWIGKLCSSLRPYCQPERQVMLWTAPLAPERFRPANFPVFSIESPLGRFYGFPDHCDQGFKIGKCYHLRQRVQDPGAMDRTCHPEDEALLREGITSYFPEADGPTRRTAACIFTNTPDGHFILDRLPDDGDVFVAAGFSGHGYKFCSVIGKLMAEFCQDRSPEWDIDRFRLSPRRWARRA